MRLKQTRKKNISLHKNDNIIQSLAEADKGTQPNWIGLMREILKFFECENKSFSKTVILRRKR